MQKLLALIVFATLSVSTQVSAVDFPEGASPFFFNSPTAYSSQYFDTILQAYNLQLDPAAAIPFTYAKVSDGKATLNAVPTAYEPQLYHTIFSAYGLELTVANAKEKLKIGSYAKVVNDSVVFGGSPMAYGGKEWANILSAYSLAHSQETVTPAPAKQTTTPVVVGDDDGDGVPNDRDACPDTPKYAAVDERGCWALDSAVLFDFDKAVIKKEFYSLLDNTKAAFDNAPKMKVQIEGHADSTGPEAYNQNLSERRAKAVVKYLVEKVGIAADRLSAIGFGELKPAFTNDTKEGQAKNRRVEFTPAK